MTDFPHGALTPPEYQAIIRRDANELLALLPGADLAAPVPACPDWRVRDLIDHLGRAHQWARLNATSGLDSTSPDHPTSGPGDGEDLAGWYGGCVADLLAALAATDPATPCWTFQPGNRQARFWFRRQSHETAMHRNDLAAAVGLDYRYEPAHAADGVGEVLEVFLHRRKVYGVPPLDVPVPVLVECTDQPARWLISPEPEDPTSHFATGPDLPDAQARTAATRIRGTAAGLLFTLWKRQDPKAADLTMDGDRDLATRLLASKLTP